MNENKEKGIVLDTSILLHIEEYKLNVFEEASRLVEGKIRFYIPFSVIKEIEAMSRNRGKKGIKAKTALLVLKKYEDNIDVIPSGKVPDKAVLNLAEDLSAIVATSDKKLKDRALKKGLKVIIATGKKAILV